MFNNFYDNMPPIDLGKKKSLGLIIAYGLLFLTLLGIIGSLVYVIIESTSTNTAINWISYVLLVIPVYLVGKGIFKAYKFILLPYSKKSFAIKYGDLQLLKKGMFYQLLFIGITLAFKGFAALNAGATATTSEVFYYIILSVSLVIILGIYMTFNSMLKPYRNELRERMMKQRQEMQEQMAKNQGGSPNPGGASPFGFRTPPFANAPPKDEKVSDEDIVRGSGGKVIDITEDINMEPKKEEKDEDDTSPPPLSAL